MYLKRYTYIYIYNTYTQCLYDVYTYTYIYMQYVTVFKEQEVTNGSNGRTWEIIYQVRAN